MNKINHTVYLFEKLLLRPDILQQFPKFLQQPTKTEVGSQGMLRMVIGYLRIIFWEVLVTRFPFKIGAARTSETTVHKINSPSWRDGSV